MESLDAQPQSNNPSFEVKKTIDQTPFKEDAVRPFFDKWCEINDSIVPQIASRQYWEQNVKEQGILRKNPDGTSTLFIPNDIHLWEMVEVIKTIDQDTFVKKPELREKKKQELLNLGKMFRNSGIHIAQRVNSIDEGRPLAEELAQEFFGYGNALVTGYMEQEKSEIPIERIALNPISPEETEDVDRWLAGESLYKTRMERVKKEIANHSLEEADRIIEDGRQETLRQFFRVSEKAFLRQQKSPQGLDIDKEKPWSTAKPIHSTFLQRIQDELKKSVQAPKTELHSSIFNRGTEKLLTEMEGPETDKIINDIEHMLNGSETRKLIDILKVEQLKKDLQKVRQQGDINEISRTEIEIAKKIQEAVARFPYDSLTDNPSEIIKNKQLNCLGATILAGALLNEVGISYLQVLTPDHTILLLITADSRVFWQDMQLPFLNEELSNNDIRGRTKDGKDMAISDLVAFSRTPTREGLLLKLQSSFQRKKMSLSKEENQFAYVSDPEIGQQAGLLVNTSGVLLQNGLTKESIEAIKLQVEITPNDPIAYDCLGRILFRSDRYEEAVDSFKKAIELNPENYSTYIFLGNALRRLERYEEASNVYKKSIAINPKSPNSYNGLGNIAYILGKNDEALLMYGMAIGIDSKSPHPHNGLANVLMETGEYQEAIREYRVFISLANKKYDKDFIARANSKIQELEEKLSQE